MNEQPVATTFGRRASDRMTKPMGPLSYDGQPDWLDTLLVRAHALVNKSPTLIRILASLFNEPVLSHRLEFAAFLDQALRSAYDYNRLFVQFGGVPLEVEMKSVYGERWAFIRRSGDVATGIKWTVVFFDRSGIRLEREFDFGADALNVMVDDGFVLHDDAALLRVSGEDKWAGGVQSTVSVALPSESMVQAATEAV
ncbi:hypothetical protein [Ottowia sp.]|uniref:hypothetical protein n=1 Tax=Ottowia sp. TaxID=1898956 RepID=UPI0025EA9AC4|nr:hypothetical protein [Ottowia sp.]MBK6616395.1 hypothetical protein [Ottowia sp.]